MLKDAEQYIIEILLAITPNIDYLKTDILLMSSQDKKLVSSQEATKSILSLINSSKLLLKEFDDQIITQEILLLSFTIINDEAKGILSKYNITYNTLLEEIKKFRKGNKAMNNNAESGFDTLNRFAVNLTIKASKGQLDPVIGRDEEIRRLIQVL